MFIFLNAIVDFVAAAAEDDKYDDIQHKSSNENKKTLSPFYQKKQKKQWTLSLLIFMWQIDKLSDLGHW